ncbi:MAG: hypothetical protein HYR64_07370 [Fimbriimonas ginsengisoli]|uniref:Uncharacterized protein n=1 Tax=Fimbriimonas ginsengisoli TaxID=1005039 RepID=A0A931LT05_FIMGI|nr:hypothetical protein [Fimbriimonas ginsengisoli]
MVITFFAAAIALQQLQVPVDTKCWPMAMTHTKVAQRSIAWHERKNGGHTAARGKATPSQRPTAIHADPFFIGDEALLRAHWREVDEALHDARWLVSHRRYEEAADLYHIVQAKYPQDDMYLHLEMFDADFGAGRYRRAYEDIAPYIKPWAGADDLLRASLSAALAEEVYPGQKAYVANWMGTYMSDRVRRQTPDHPLVPVAQSAADIATLSALAIGSDLGSQYALAEPYLRFVLSKDAANPFAGFNLAMNLHFESRFSEEIPVIDAALTTLEPGELRDLLERQRDLAVAWLAAQRGK